VADPTRLAPPAVPSEGGRQPRLTCGNVLVWKRNSCQALRSAADLVCLVRLSVNGRRRQSGSFLRPLVEWGDQSCGTGGQLRSGRVSTVIRFGAPRDDGMYAN
jgi:hypothetical protein